MYAGIVLEDSHTTPRADHGATTIQRLDDVHTDLCDCNLVGGELLLPELFQPLCVCVCVCVCVCGPGGQTTV